MKDVNVVKMVEEGFQKSILYRCKCNTRTAYRIYRASKAGHEK